MNWYLLTTISISLSLFNLSFAYQKLNTRQTKLLASQFPPENYLKVDDQDGFLQPILIPRVPGSQGSQTVRDHFHAFFDSLPSKQWDIQYDQFNEDTPIESNVSFTNMVITRDPPNSTPGKLGRLVLAAHYDSKFEPSGFIGAIDSAVPCALIMYVAKALDEYLSQKWDTSANTTGVQIIFFDGEEAYKEWTDTDSIYGARHLAQTMEHEIKYAVDSTRLTDLQSMDTMVLLDLLGSSVSSIPSYFRETDWMHKKLGIIQDRLARLKISKSQPDQSPPKTFFPRPPMFQFGGLIGDDHVPFLKRGVPILHLIPTPFPPVWHTMDDDGSHLDSNAVHDWGLILSTFVAEYFELGSVIGAIKEYL